MNRGSEKCLLCGGSGDNQTGLIMRVNNDICPRCGGYGRVPKNTPENTAALNQEDKRFAKNNGWVEDATEQPQAEKT